MSTTNLSLTVQQPEVQVVELIVDRLKTQDQDQTVDEEDKCPSSRSVTYGESVISVFLLSIVVADVLILSGILNVVIMLSNDATKYPSDSDGRLGDVRDLTIFSILCLASSVVFAKVYHRVRQRKSRILMVCYMLSVITHALSLHYEGKSIANMRAENGGGIVDSRGIAVGTLNFIWYTIRVEYVIMSALFLGIFARRIFIAFIAAKAVNFKMLFVVIFGMLFLVILFSVADVACNHGAFLHHIALVFGIFSAKVHSCCGGTHHHNTLAVNDAINPLAMFWCNFFACFHHWHICYCYNPICCEGSGCGASCCGFGCGCTDGCCPGCGCTFCCSQCTC